MRLRARPRRRETSLVDGVFLVTRDTADVVRVGGRLARSPSFWVHGVETRRHYARIRGHRVVVRLEAIASIRLLARSTVVVTYDHDSIDGERIPPATVAAADAPSADSLVASARD